VSASFGGFHAAASLADDGSAMASAGGNGLGASSGYGSGGAGAGAGFIGVSEFVSTGTPMKPAIGGYGNSGKPEGPYYPGGAGAGVGGNGSGGLFDRIFAVSLPIYCTRSDDTRIFLRGCFNIKFKYNMRGVLHTLHCSHQSLY